MNVGAHKRKATYFRGTNSNKLKFSCTVKAQDYDNNGVSVPAGSLLLTDGATIVAADDATAAEFADQDFDQLPESVPETLDCNDAYRAPTQETDILPIIASSRAARGIFSPSQIGVFCRPPAQMIRIQTYMLV